MRGHWTKVLFYRPPVFYRIKIQSTDINVCMYINHIGTKGAHHVVFFLCMRLGKFRIVRATAHVRYLWANTTIIRGTTFSAERYTF